MQLGGRGNVNVKGTIICNEHRGCFPPQDTGWARQNYFQPLQMIHRSQPISPFYFPPLQAFYIPPYLQLTLGNRTNHPCRGVFSNQIISDLEKKVMQINLDFCPPPTLQWIVTVITKAMDFFTHFQMAPPDKRQVLFGFSLLLIFRTSMTGTFRVKFIIIQ